MATGATSDRREGTLSLSTGRRERGGSPSDRDAAEGNRRSEAVISCRTSANTKLSSSKPNVPRSALPLSKERPSTVASRPEWLHRRDQEHLRKQPDITLPRFVTDVDAGAELRIVPQLAGVLGQQPYEFRKVRQLLDGRDIRQIAREDRREIGSRPVLPPALAVATDRFGEAMLIGIRQFFRVQQNGGTSASGMLGN